MSGHGSAESSTDPSSRVPHRVPEITRWVSDGSEITVQALRDLRYRLRRRVDLEVVLREPVHGLGLPAREAESSITPLGFAADRDLDVAPHADEHRGESGERVAPLVPLVVLDHHVVDDDVHAAARDLGDRTAVRGEQPPAQLTDVKARAVTVVFEAYAVFAERTLPRVDLDPRSRQPGHEVVDAEHDPALAAGRAPRSGTRKRVTTCPRSRCR